MRSQISRILVIEKEECRVWVRKELSIYKRLSETEYGWSAEVKQEGEWYNLSLEGRQATVHTYRQTMYAMMKEEKKRTSCQGQWEDIEEF